MNRPSRTLNASADQLSSTANPTRRWSCPQAQQPDPLGNYLNTRLGNNPNFDNPHLGGIAYAPTTGGRAIAVAVTERARPQLAAA